jgi:hypothetical protein
MLLQFYYVTKFPMPLIMLYFLYNLSCHYYIQSQRMKVIFHINKVGEGFTVPSEPMRRPYGNDAPHIKL